MDRKYYYQISNRMLHPDENSMVAKLLDDSILFVANRKVLNLNGDVEGETLSLFVNANDVFILACDSELISLEEIPKLFEMVNKSPCGAIKWLAFKRNETPRERLLQHMGNERSELDGLPLNKFEFGG